MHSKEKERMPVSDVWKMSRNRPREQNFHALRTSAEVKAGSACFLLSPLQMDIESDIQNDADQR